MDLETLESTNKALESTNKVLQEALDWFKQELADCHTASDRLRADLAECRGGAARVESR